MNPKPSPFKGWPTAVNMPYGMNQVLYPSETAAAPVAPAPAAPSAPATTAGTGLHAVLREGTQAAHGRIESALALGRLGTQPEDLQRYGRVLQAFALFQRHWQPRVRAALPPPLHAWLDASPRLDWLLQDLEAMALPPPAAELPDPTQALALPGASAALASLYVLEGSALGGQVIVRALSRTAPGLAERATRYFQGHGARTGAHWRQFCSLLADTPPETPHGWPGAVRASNLTFDALLDSARTLGATAGPACTRTA